MFEATVNCCEGMPSTYKFVKRARSSRKATVPPHVSKLLQELKQATASEWFESQADCGTTYGVSSRQHYDLCDECIAIHGPFELGDEDPVAATCHSCRNRRIQHTVLGYRAICAYCSSYTPVVSTLRQFFLITAGWKNLPKGLCCAGCSVRSNG